MISKIAPSSTLTFLTGTLVALVLALGATPAGAASEQEELVTKAQHTIASFMFDEELSWFHENVKKAKALLIVPMLREGALGIGGSGGKGVFLVHNQKTGWWSEPAFYSAGGFSLGIKAGFQESEVVVMVMTKKAIDAFMKSSFKFGGDLKVTFAQKGGGLARGAGGDLISFSRSKGGLIGASLGGAKISIDTKSNEAYYGKAATPKEIVMQDKVSNPQSVALRVTIRESAMTKMQ